MSEKELNKKELKVGFNTIAMLFLGAMFLLAAFQTVQLSELKQEIETPVDLTQFWGTANLAPAQQQTQSVPQSLQDIPDMVGGC